MFAFRGRYVFPVDGPPLGDGVVAVDHDRIVAVGDASSPAAREFGPSAIDLGNAAILPGLVNAHTHLEFSDLTAPLGEPEALATGGTSFPEWIRLVVQHRREHPPAPPLDPIACGIAESSRCGVTALGEIASTPWWRDGSFPLEITQFCEVIAVRLDADDVRYRTAIDAVTASSNTSEQSPRWSETFRPGISPHAPYSVHPELLRRVVSLSAERRIPLAHHLAESRDELMLLADGTGPLVELMQDFGQWIPGAIPHGSKPLDYLWMLSDAHRALVIHGNYLDDAEIEFLAARSATMSVVYCPRTHVFFGHDRYPLAEILAAGVNVALGTDSRASNPDLNVLAEMQFAAKQHPEVSPTTLLRTITASAAKALGRDGEIGTLAPGKFADLAIVTLPEHDAADPHELLLNPACRVTVTMFRGRAVHGELSL